MDISTERNNTNTGMEKGRRLSVSLLSTLSFYHGWNYDNYDFSVILLSTSTAHGSAIPFPHIL